MVLPLKKQSSGGVLVVLVTAVNQGEAVKIGKKVVAAKLAACVSIIPGIQSIYRWKGKVVKEQEALLIMKSTKKCYRALERAVKTMHTYETPEIIALPIEAGFGRYIEWVHSETHS
jgi:periplasmic divalent cation tolerance protein